MDNNRRKKGENLRRTLIRGFLIKPVLGEILFLGLFLQYLSERHAMVTQYFLNLFVWYAVLSTSKNICLSCACCYILYMEIVEFCNAINILRV